MLPETLEGQWEDVRAHDAELMGHRVRLIILPTENSMAQTLLVPPTPNYAMLEAMRVAEKIQEGMQPKPGSDGVAIVREGRAGAMYGDYAEDGQSAADCD